MALIELKIPAGVIRHGTDLDSSGRWRDTNLVRWRNGSARPVGGWEDFATSNGSAVQFFATQVSVAGDNISRGCHSWRTLANTAYLGIGTAKKLYVVATSGTATDITPAGFVSGSLGGENVGFGGKNYGEHTYGTERPSDGQLTAASTWSLDNWGEYLVGCADGDGKIYEWQLNTSNAAAQVTNAPTNNTSIVVTAERFIFALGAQGNSRKIKWCDKEDNTSWTAAATNEAGDIELPTNGDIISGVRVRGRTLIFTTVDAFVAVYSGPPTVYGFQRVGVGCGLAAPLGYASIDIGAFWIGSNGFFMYDGQAATEITCDVADYVFGDINRAEFSKVFAVANQKHGEIWWFYPSSGATENDRYVAFDYKEKHWIIGTLGRAAGVDAGIFDYPVWLDSTNKGYYHEKGNTHGGTDPHLESGPIYIGTGNQVMRVNAVVPDEETANQVTLTFKTRLYPNASETSHGPYTLANPTSVRFTGRQVRMRVNGTDAADWKVGTMRLDASTGGQR